MPGESERNRKNGERGKRERERSITRGATGPTLTVAGLLLDTANHFISPPAIKTIVSEMADNRLNVLHWHIEDSYSFPYVSRAFPALSKAGAWDPSATYSPEDIASITEHARVRGVRVVMELDVPGHTYSWGLAYPALTIPCPATMTGTDIGSINSVGLDPSNNDTYTLVRGLLDELMTMVSQLNISFPSTPPFLVCMTS